ncbi:MAG: hypothetical protein AMS24_00065 [Chlamydiae bacterium SM23_39]|nr:MAG: hypothetical protein AMS24_00065 [Chlamydiae bacterium SM23_39]
MQRLSKILVSRGIASRRKCEEIIKNNRVKVNNQLITLPQFMVDEKKDLIELDNIKISKKEKKVYYILNKPAGYLSTNCPYTKKKKVIDLFPKKPRIFTVGRLDKNSKGLLIITNDGYLAHKIMHPSSNIEKEYLVYTEQKITSKHTKIISKGIIIKNRIIKPVSLKKISFNSVSIIVKEGKKHEIRLFLKNANLKVKDLIRIRIGFLKLKNLKEGEYRNMTKKEIDKFLFFIP